MAGDWIKMRTNLPTDPRVIRIAAATKRTPLHICGCLLLVWGTADAHTTDGRLTGYTKAVVDTLTQTKGLADALEEADWGTFDDQGMTVPDFDRHNGESAKRRALKARSEAQNRHRRGHSVSTNCPPREEKRREEKKQQQQQQRQPQVCAPPDEVDPPAAAAAGELRSWAEGMAKRPEWLPTGKPWIEADVWIEMANNCPRMTIEKFEAIVKEAKASKGTLKNPAGFIISKIKAATGASA